MGDGCGSEKQEMKEEQKSKAKGVIKVERRMKDAGTLKVEKEMKRWSDKEGEKVGDDGRGGPEGG